MKYQSRRFSITAPPDPPNSFFALRVPALRVGSTSDPASEAPSTGLRNSRSPLVVGLRLNSPRPARRAPFHMLQPMVRGTRRPQTGRNPDVPAMFARGRGFSGSGKRVSKRSCRLKADRNQLRSCSYDAGIGDQEVQFRLGWTMPCEVERCRRVACEYC
ncbi:MAG: hypothetical protein A4E57_00576 [Syntrophorhabdaceae bacterium PtaU1.Bin034]|nr:MAG: hypothetical protein A4E57_00576 [Syntrophorhabdaceae bacterium PtaU1.Bin034]